MKTRIIILASLAIASLLFASYQPGNAKTYYNHDGTVDKHLTKIKVEPYKGKKDLWVYLVKACATDRNLSIAAVTLKSDMSEHLLGVNKSIKEGDCSVYGAVMKARDGNTLGAELIERHEAVQRMQDLMEGEAKHMPPEDRDEISRLQFITGVYLR